MGVGQGTQQIANEQRLGTWPHPSSLNTPGSPVQWRRSQQERYLPDNILIWTVAALTALDEDPQVHQTG